MAERPTFCPRCGHMHSGICLLAKSEPVAHRPERPLVERKEEGSTPGRAPIPAAVHAEVAAIEAGQPKRDRAAYMRDYRAKHPKVAK